VARLPTFHHEVLGDDLEEINRYVRLQEITIVFLTQAKAIA
jgi:hypothetical protein